MLLLDKEFNLSPKKMSFYPSKSHETELYLKATCVGQNFQICNRNVDVSEGQKITFKKKEKISRISLAIFCR